jgi:integrase-like protein
MHCSDTAVWTWAARRDEAGEANPAKGIEKFPEKKRERYLTPDELGRLRDSLAVFEANGGYPFAAAAIRLLALTGARLHEVLDARWAEVDVGRNILFLRGSKTGAKPLYLSAAAQAVLADLPRLEHNEHLIPGAHHGKPKSNLVGPWSIIRKAAGLPDVRLHDLRHSYASVGAGNGMSLPLAGAQPGSHDSQVRAPRCIANGQGSGHDRIEHRFGDAAARVGRGDLDRRETERLSYRSRLLEGDLEQKVLAMASEVLIVASPAPAWIAKNAPCPIAPTRLRLVIILPPENDDRFDELHYVVHIAVALARKQAGLATHMWLGDCTRIGGPTEDKTIEPRRTRMHVMIGKNARVSKTVEWLLDASREIRIKKPRFGGAAPTVIGGGIETTIFSSGVSAAHFMGILNGRKFELAGFQRKDLPSAFKRRAMCACNDSGGFCVEGSRELPASLNDDYTIIVWGDDDMEKPAKH